LPPAAFAELWNASAAVDGALRDLRIEAETDKTGFYRIIHVDLFESMPEAINFNPKKALLRRVDPATTELREWRQGVYGWFLLFLVFGCTVLAVVLIEWVGSYSLHLIR
jgi:hypothetical protein